MCVFIVYNHLSKTKIDVSYQQGLQYYFNRLEKWLKMRFLTH
ncbi:hypothetical protein HMPREF2531_00251 [Bacteroides intestinalis]|uniref:Uncharacterized protein n=1 Tax=Bacteroides intestinalis TaxID=329854 RepID=A0A139LV81_9BACE|nr:hypothetical protein HMPREF2531_00251 [Bacteroides intestinalis]